MNLRYQDLVAVGVNVSKIGSHSFRKGVATALSSSPCAPPPCCIFLRAGWSLGQVQAKYIVDTAGGDQWVGRV